MKNNTFSEEYASKVQNFGEQHPDFHSKEMKAWRKKDKQKAQVKGLKVITYSKVGYNAPSQANWSYGIWKVDFIDTDKKYNMSHTVKENFGGESRMKARVLKEHGYELIETKGIYTATGTPKITGVSKMLDFEGQEVYEIIRDFLTK